jgi:hypothetical protein
MDLKTQLPTFTPRVSGPRALDYKDTLDPRKRREEAAEDEECAERCGREDDREEMDRPKMETRKRKR